MLDCVFGDACRRRNPDHWKEESHPTMTYEKLPVLPCKFGSSCKDDSPLHLKLYDHLSQTKKTVKKRKRTDFQQDPEKTDSKDTKTHSIDFSDPNLILSDEPQPKTKMKDGDKVQFQSLTQADVSYTTSLSGGVYYCKCPSLTRIIICFSCFFFLQVPVQHGSFKRVQLTNEPVPI
jgi:hypothetical protein